MSVKVLSKAERFGLLFQADWANTAALKADSAYKLCQWINAGTPNPNPDVQVDQFNVTSQNGIHYESERFFVDATSGLPTIPFSGTCEKATMAPFLVGALQAVTEAGTTPYLKTITCGGIASPVDFAADAGFLHVIAVDQGGTDDGVILYNAIIQNLNIVWDLNARGVARLVNMNGAWVGNEMTYEQTLNGTWVNATIAQSFFNNTDAWTFTLAGALTIDGTDYSAECIRRVELQINNNVTSNCKTTGGKANQYDIAPEYKFIITLDYNATTEKILKDYTTGANALVIWTNDSSGATTDGMWTVGITTGAFGKLMSPPKIYNGDFLGIQLELRAYSTAGNSPLTVLYTDTVDYGY